MTKKSRRMGVAALTALTLCLGLTGCLNTQTAFQQPMLHQNNCNSFRPGTSPSGTVIHSAGVSTMHPGGSDIVQTSYLSRGPGRHAQPGQPSVVDSAHPDGNVVESVPIEGPVVHGVGGCPRELDMRSHPPVTVAPPDILIIDAIRLVPKGPYRLEPLEVLQISMAEKLPNEPIGGPYVITPEGSVNLGFNYGSVPVAGLTVDQAQDAIRRHLGGILKNANVNVALVQFRGIQQIRGEHLVRSDGTISLGTYGSVYVAGMTLGQVKCQIENYLGAYLINPQVSVDVLAYNSKKYYVIMDGGGFGQQIVPLPITGNETVLDAISQVQGLNPVSSKHRIWLARPSPVHLGCNQILPVDWRAITEGGSTATNYQIFPGDRVYVSANRLIAFDNYLSMLLAPVERIFGITLLGNSTVQSFRGNGGFNNNNGGFFRTFP